MDFILIAKFLLIAFLGGGLGYFYGFSFIKEKKKTLLSYKSSGKSVAFALSISMLVKYFALAGIILFLSRYGMGFTLAMTLSFLIGFWWYIIKETVNGSRT